MRRLILPSYVIFITVGCIWAVFYSLHVSLPTPDHPVLIYSNHKKDNLKRVFKQAIKSAHKSITLSIYALTDPDIINLIQKKASEGVKTTLFYDNKATSLPPRMKALCELHPYFGTALMHRKLLMIDDELTLIGSSNLTTSSLKCHDNFVMAIHSPKLATRTLYRPSTTLSLSEQTATLWLLPEASTDALNGLIKHLDSAKKMIHLALFTLSHPDLVDALLRAHQRGVQVTCILDHYTAEGASKNAHEFLLQSGVRVTLSRGDQLFHHKWVLIDETTLIFGSANWTRAAFSKNGDCLMELTPLTEEQRKWMRKIWNSITSLVTIQR